MCDFYEFWVKFFKFYTNQMETDGFRNIITDGTPKEELRRRRRLRMLNYALALFSLPVARCPDTMDIPIWVFPKRMVYKGKSY